MEMFDAIVNWLGDLVWSSGIPVGEETIPFIVIALLGTGFFLTVRTGFIQIRRLGHGFAVTSGRYDDPNEPGDVSHFQALTTALSATVGIGNIAGVAIAIHFGGPGALFWMWMTAILGMAVKYVEVTLSMTYRDVGPDADPSRWEGSVSGGPMYYIERGLTGIWKPVAKPLAVLFALGLILSSFLTGNGVQANTVADTMATELGIAPWITGAVTATLVALVILGGIRRIGAVTAVLAPLMAAIYVVGALTIIAMNLGQVVPIFALILREAFQPTAGIAGTGVGVFLTTMMWGVRRGLFSNEAGQGSAPIAHAAAQTDEPVSEGVVALLGPFIDTLVICSMTGLVILITGVWNEPIATEMTLLGGDVSFVSPDADGVHHATEAPEELVMSEGVSVDPSVHFAWHDVRVRRLFADGEMTRPFTGTIRPRESLAITEDGERLGTVYGMAVESSAPLTRLAFERGLAPLVPWGGAIVIISVLLFAVSTAISWSYYGDRCAMYLFGPRSILPYKVLFVATHFLGAVLSLSTIWTLGDVALGLVTFPNLLAIVLLSGVVVTTTKSYFERKPWLENAEVHRRLVEERRRKKR